MDPAVAAAFAAATERGICSTAYLRACHNPTQPTTSIDLLEVRKDEDPQAEIASGLDHDALVRRFERPGSDDGSSLLMLFINFTPTPGGNRTVLASLDTLKFLRDRFGVSLLFVDSLGPIQWGAKSGNACFNHYNDAGGVVRTDAFYHFATEDRGCDIWFSYHHPPTERTTYILSCCSVRAKAHIMRCALGNDRLSLLRPMIIDTFLADAAFESLKDILRDSRGMLMTYENRGASQLPTESVQDDFQKLHQLSVRWHILYENLIDNEEALNFILAIHKQFSGPPWAQTSSFDQESNYEAVQYLITRNTIWKRWVGNYNTRTQIRINLYFNLASQVDNKTNIGIAKTNIEIANTSKEIASATLKDSSSMITIATMTMLFLPGTFVSAILSMAFFNNGTDTSGQPTLTVLPQWWIFPVTTIPLTLLVFGLWRIWQQKRLKRTAHADAEKRFAFLDMKAHVKRLRSLYPGKAEVLGADDQVIHGDAVARKRRRNSAIRSLFARKREAEASVARVSDDAP